MVEASLLVDLSPAETHDDMPMTDNVVSFKLEERHLLKTLTAVLICFTFIFQLHKHVAEAIADLLEAYEAQLVTPYYDTNDGIISPALNIPKGELLLAPRIITAKAC